MRGILRRFGVGLAVAGACALAGGAPGAGASMLVAPALPESPPEQIAHLVTEGQWDRFAEVARRYGEGESWYGAFGDPAWFGAYWERWRADGSPLTLDAMPQYVRDWVASSYYEVYLCQADVRGEGEEYPGFHGELVFVDATGRATCAMVDQTGPGDPENSSGVFTVGVRANWGMNSLPDPPTVVTRIPICSREGQLLGVQHLGGLEWSDPAGGTPPTAGEAESITFYGVTSNKVGPLVLPGDFTQYIPEEGIGVMHAECDGSYDPTPTVTATFVFAAYRRVLPDL